MEYGETPEQTAARELKEETNIDLKNPRVIGITNDIMSADEKHYITIFVEAEYAGGDLRNDETESSETGWFSKESLPSPLFIPLKNFLENKRLF